MLLNIKNAHRENSNDSKLNSLSTYFKNANLKGQKADEIK